MCVSCTCLLGGARFHNFDKDGEKPTTWSRGNLRIAWMYPPIPGIPVTNKGLVTGKNPVGHLKKVMIVMTVAFLDSENVDLTFITLELDVFAYLYLR